MLHDLDEFWRVRSLADFQALSPAARERVLPFIQRWVLAVREVDGTTVLRDYASIMALQRATVAATEPYDLVLSPVAPVTAFPAEWPMPWGEEDRGMAHIGFTAPYNMSGQPAASVNCGFTHDGRTIGLQVSGRRFDDVGVLCAVDWFEGHRPDSAKPAWPIPEMSDIGGSRG
jgi:aspartyl-tRNA(Asn)/glutamyl-tRNA(Gln) amidotransferase subunit A